MPVFKITYIDPDEGDEVQVVKEFEDSHGLSAREWAEDYAYEVAGKVNFTVEEQP